MARLLTLALALAAVCAVTAVPELDVKTRAILDNHVAVLTSKGEHLKEDVPEDIRGEKFTTENLHKYYSVEDVKVTVHDRDTGAEVDIGELAAAAKAADAALPEPVKKIQTARRMLLQTPEDIEKIVAIGKEIWQIVEDNRPVVSTAATAPMSAIPKACESNWMSMAGFKSHTTYDVQWTWINGFKSTVVDFSFAWTFKSNGQCFVDNKGYGNFIRDAGVAAKNLHASWGYTVNVEGRAFSPYNAGSMTNPVAAMDLEVKMTHSTVLVENHQTCRVEVQGNGSGKTVNCDFFPNFRLKY